MTFVKVSVLAMLLTLPIRAQDGAVQGAFTKYRIEDLPAAVQKTVQEHSGGRPIADIAREERNGQTVWRSSLIEKVGIQEFRSRMTGHCWRKSSQGLPTN